MGHDEFRLKRNKEREERRSKLISQKPSKWLIVCEGEETEVNYFEMAIRKINETLPDEKKIKATIKGEGRNTKSLVKTAEDLQAIVDKYNKRTVYFGKIFVVFDKDDFSDSAFNDAVTMCKNNGFIPLWSNEAIEFWFLLHFNYIDSALSRNEYEDKINQFFKDKGQKYEYHKNDKEIFDKLCSYGSLELARKNAKRRVDECKGKTPAKSLSCTTVHQFFDEVDLYIEEVL